MKSFEVKLSRVDALLLLNGLPKLGPVSLRKILHANNNDPSNIFALSRSKLLSIGGVGSTIADTILDPSNVKWLRKEKERIDSLGVSFLTEDHIPSLLQEIYDPPIGLYSRGLLPNGPYIAIVGTRQPSLYGQRICYELSSGLAKAGFCIVSGMARGVDTVAHQAALDVKGKTIAFLGSGLDIIYPPENIKLYQNISDNGAVLSEFPFGRKADRRTFPMRNRLVSGISSAVIVVESALNGGSLITARFAADQGRQVFAVPGRVDQPASAGCNELIRDGATLVRSARDVVEEIEGSLIESISFSRDHLTEKEIIRSKDCRMRIISEDEKTVMEAFVDGSVYNGEELVEKTKLSIPKLSAILTSLELKELIKKRSDGRFETL